MEKQGWLLLNRGKPVKMQPVNNRLRVQIDKNYYGAGRHDLIYQYEKNGMLLLVPADLKE
jgi:hypothetical protein